MNKLLIGLLIIAAGAGTFLYLRNKKKETVSNEFKKELIIGKWKTNDVLTNDSNFNKFQFNFQQNGTIIRSLNDSAKADTFQFEWNKANELVWAELIPTEKEKPIDSIGKIYKVIKLTADSFQVKAADSSIILFTKVN